MMSAIAKDLSPRQPNSSTRGGRDGWHWSGLRVSGQHDLPVLVSGHWMYGAISMQICVGDVKLVGAEA